MTSVRTHGGSTLTPSWPTGLRRAQATALLLRSTALPTRHICLALHLMARGARPPLLMDTGPPPPPPALPPPPPHPPRPPLPFPALLAPPPKTHGPPRSQCLARPYRPAFITPRGLSPRPESPHSTLGRPPRKQGGACTVCMPCQLRPQPATSAGTHLRRMACRWPTHRHTI